ncbi:L,D-transpeptidase [soil metagenome]
MNRFKCLVVALLAGSLVACGGESSEPAAPADERTGTEASGYWEEDRLTAEELERGRLDGGWRRVVQLDTIAGVGAGENPESWEDISAAAVNQSPMHLPLHGDVAGPSVLRLQILLDRALFSPGAIDGRWGKNTEKAVYWLQRREGLPATGQVDERTFERLVELARRPEQLVREHRLTAKDVEGPFVSIPEDIYAQAELDCLCYESLTEKLSEMFHVTADVLRQLNPEVEMDQLTEGSTIRVPQVRDEWEGQVGQVARLVVSDEGSYVHAVDANGRIVYHFPSTLGSSYDPSPTGDHRVVSITEDPWWHYQPSILAHVDNSKPDARIPPGPNNAVGRVWMALSKPHYGIHGTKAPETIGYTSSAGCVRLTNWDAIFLSRRIDEGVPVEFRDT